MKKRVALTERNWPLVLIGSILILVGLMLVVIAIIYIKNLGGWGILVGLTGLAAVGASIVAIVENDPSWILLDLFLS